MPGPSALFATLLGLVAVTGPASSQETGRAFVLDTGANVLVALDLAAGKRIAQLPLVGTPSGFQLSPDGRHLALLDRGPGEDKDERGYRATGKSSVTIVDTATLKVVGRVVLGFGIEPGSSTSLPDGRMALLCPGYDAKDPKESLTRELVTFDLATARETGRLALEPGTFIVGQSRDQRTLALLQGQPRAAKFPFPKSKVFLVDVAGPTVAATLDAGTWRSATTVDDRVYLVDPGEADKNPQKNRNAAIDVVNLKERRIERLDAGWATVTGGWFDDLVLLASKGRPGGSAGELRVFRGGSLAATLAVAEEPKLVEKARETFYVVGAKAVTLVDPVTLEVSGTIPLVRGADPIVGDGDHPFELAVTPDRRRVFIHYPAEDKVAVLDLEQRRAIGSTKTGRGGKKVLNGLTSGLYYGATEQTFNSRAGAAPQMQVRSDGRFGYALNRDTNDVTVVDADTAQAVEKIGGGGYEVRLLGDRIVVVGSEIHLIDATRNVKVEEIRLPGLRGMLVSPDGAFAVSFAERTVLILDGATGKERARLTDFVKPTRLAFGRSSVPAVP